MARKKIGLMGNLHYNPERDITITISKDVKKRLVELKTKYRLKSYSSAIELLLNENEKKKKGKIRTRRLTRF